MTTLTMGIDLAARPEKTAVCLLAWDGGLPEVVTLRRGRAEDGTAFYDKWLSATAYGLLGDYHGSITKVGIDDPFGWPVPFLDAVASYRHGPAWPSAIDDPRDQFRLRETDRVVHERSGRWPLSVSADRIAIPAMRCAVLLTDIARHRGPDAVSRDGAGLCCEVYPDPALRNWTKGSKVGLGKASYKGPEHSSKRVDLLKAMTDQLPIEDPRDELAQVGQEDDYLDALVCALVARAAELGQTHSPRAGIEAERAAVEGWIHLPSHALSSVAVFESDPR